ncbi:hypothetical protein ACPCXF_04770 [Lysinibacillus agricola]
MQLLKELEVLAVESEIFIQLLESDTGYTPSYQEELDLEVN